MQGTRTSCACVVAGGSSGWQAPEQLLARSGSDVKQSRAVDVFSLGLVLYYCLTGGKHAFGEGFERDSNILQVSGVLQVQQMR